MKKLNCLLSMVLAIVLCFGTFAGCGKKPQEDNSALNVWTTSSNDKIKMTDAMPENADDTLRISLAGGEAESAQIIMTADKKIVSSYSVETEDLKSGSDVLSKSNIEVYIEKYVYAKKFKPTPGGWFPDAIVPYELVKQAGELSFNPEGELNSQGIWITINAPRGQNAGVYTGNISVTVSDEKFSVPVKCQIYDFDINEEIHAKTAFAIWEDRNMIEYGYGIDYKDKTDGLTIPEKLAKKDRILKNEYEFLASKKIAPTNIPQSEYKVSGASSFKASDFAKAAKKYASRPEISAYRIPVDGIGEKRVFEKSVFINILRELSKSSIENNEVVIDLFAKAYVYCPAIDEPHPSKDPDIYNQVEKLNNDFLEGKNIVLNELKGSKYKAVKGIDKLINSLENLPHIVTAERRDVLDGKVHSFCPQVQFYADRTYFDITEQRKITNKESAWWYTCLDPKNPYPSYHINDNLVSGRVMGWMQKDYNIDGNLYWSTNIYAKHLSGDKYGERDVWNDPAAFSDVNGDGFLTYPGTRYGLESPIGTVRLDAVRDAQEDYEYLWMLEDMLNKANLKYNTDVKFDSLVRDLYDSLYSGVVAIVDPALVLKARQEVATMIEALNSEENAIIEIKPFSSKNGKSVVNIVAESGTSVKINGKVVAYNGNSFTAETDTDVIKIEIGNKVYTRNIQGKRFSVTSFEGIETVLSETFTSENVNSVVFDGEKSLALNLSSDVAIDADEKAFATIKFNSVDLTNAKQFVMYVYNDSDSVVKPVISILDENNSSYVSNKTTAHLYPNKWNKVIIYLNSTSKMDLSKINQIEIGVKKPESGNLRLFFDNAYYF